MKIAILNDTHCGVRNSSDIFIDYQEAFYRDVFFPYLAKHNIKRILHLGDYYEHRKYVNFKALNANRKHFLDMLTKYNIRMNIIPGNHDVYYKNTNKLCALKELLGYYVNSVNIIEKPSIVDYEGFKIGLVPWINNENLEKSLLFIEKADAPMLAGHFEIAGFDMHQGIPNYDGLQASLFEKYEKVISGHFHHKSEKGNIQYLGSQMQFCWSDSEDNKFFHVLDTDTKQIEAVKNPLTMFEKVYYDDTKTDYATYPVKSLSNKFVKIIVANKTNIDMFNQFVDAVIDVLPHDVKISENYDEFLADNNIDMTSENSDNKYCFTQNSVSDMLNSYIDNTETNLDKTKLKSKANALLNEAQHQD